MTLLRAPVFSQGQAWLPTWVISSPFQSGFVEYDTPSLLASSCKDLEESTMNTDDSKGSPSVFKDVTNSEFPSLNLLEDTLPDSDHQMHIKCSPDAQVFQPSKTFTLELSLSQTQRTLPSDTNPAMIPESTFEHGMSRSDIISVFKDKPTTGMVESANGCVFNKKSTIEKHITNLQNPVTIQRVCLSPTTTQNTCETELYIPTTNTPIQCRVQQTVIEGKNLSTPSTKQSDCPVTPYTKTRTKRRAQDSPHIRSSKKTKTKHTNFVNEDAEAAVCLTVATAETLVIADIMNECLICQNFGRNAILDASLALKRGREVCELDAFTYETSSIDVSSDTESCMDLDDDSLEEYLVGSQFGCRDEHKEKDVEMKDRPPTTDNEGDGNSTTGRKRILARELSYDGKDLCQDVDMKTIDNLGKHESDPERTSKTDTFAGINTTSDITEVNAHYSDNVCEEKSQTDVLINISSRRLEVVKTCDSSTSHCFETKQQLALKQSFNSRWLGGWTGPNKNKEEGMVQNFRQTHKNYFMEPAISDLSEPGEMILSFAHSSNRPCTPQSKCCLTTTPRIDTETSHKDAISIGSSTGIQMTLSQVSVKCSLQEPPCSFVPCSVMTKASELPSGRNSDVSISFEGTSVIDLDSHVPECFPSSIVKRITSKSLRCYSTNTFSPHVEAMPNLKDDKVILSSLDCNLIEDICEIVKSTPDAQHRSTSNSQESQVRPQCNSQDTIVEETDEIVRSTPVVATEGISNDQENLPTQDTDSQECLSPTRHQSKKLQKVVTEGISNDQEDLPTQDKDSQEGLSPTWRRGIELKEVATEGISNDQENLPMQDTDFQECLSPTWRRCKKLQEDATEGISNDQENLPMQDTDFQECLSPTWRRSKKLQLSAHRTVERDLTQDKSENVTCDLLPKNATEGISNDQENLPMQDADFQQCLSPTWCQRKKLQLRARRTVERDLTQDKSENVTCDLLPNCFETTKENVHVDNLNDKEDSTLTQGNCIKQSDMSPDNNETKRSRKVHFSIDTPTHCDKSDSGTKIKRVKSSQCRGRRKRIMNSHLFKGLDFLITGFAVSQKSLQVQVQKKIEAHGGTFLSTVPNIDMAKKNSKQRRATKRCIVIAPQKVRTLKYLYGCAIGSLIVTPKWIDDCITRNSVPSTSRSRERDDECYIKFYDQRDSNPPIFGNIEAYIQGKRGYYTRLSLLIQHGGGKILQSLKSLVPVEKATKSSIQIVIVEDESNLPHNLKSTAARYGLPIVAGDWVIDSLHGGRLLALPAVCSPKAVRSDVKRTSRVRTGTESTISPQKLPSEGDTTTENVLGDLCVSFLGGGTTKSSLPSGGFPFELPATKISTSKIPRNVLFYKSVCFNGIIYSAGDIIEIQPEVDEKTQPRVAQIESFYSCNTSTAGLRSGIKNQPKKSCFMRCRWFFHPSDTGFPCLGNQKELYLSQCFDDKVDVNRILKKVQVLVIVDGVFLTTDDEVGWKVDTDVSDCTQETTDYLCRFFYDHQRESLHQLKSAIPS